MVENHWVGGLDIERKNESFFLRQTNSRATYSEPIPFQKFKSFSFPDNFFIELLPSPFYSLFLKLLILVKKSKYKIAFCQKHKFQSWQKKCIIYVWVSEKLTIGRFTKPILYGQPPVSDQRLLPFQINIVPLRNEFPVSVWGFSQLC